MEVYFDANLDSTLVHGLHLSDKNNLSFKQICKEKAVVFEYMEDYRYSDVYVSKNKLVKRSNDDPGGYWPWKGPNVKMPDLSRTDTVGDTELISTFIERSKITDVSWIHRMQSNEYFRDILVGPFKCYERTTNRGNHCLPPHSYAPMYIWTAPRQQSLTM